MTNVYILIFNLRWLLLREHNTRTPTGTWCACASRSERAWTCLGEFENENDSIFVNSWRPGQLVSMAEANPLLLWGCSVGFIVLPHLLLLIRKAWFQEKEKLSQPGHKPLPQAITPNLVGTAFRNLLKGSPSRATAILRSLPTENCQVSTRICDNNSS